MNLTLTSADGESVVIEVADDGPGISPEILATLGQRGVTHGKIGGSGLGLYHARTIVKSWGGSFAMRSQALQGTTVILHLPKARPPDWFVSVLEIDEKQPIVVVDDDTSIHQVWQGRLAPFTIVHFSTPAELRDWVKADATRALNAVYLMDYELFGHKETGLDLIDELKLGERAILVTSRFEETPILSECLRLKTRMIPKGLAGFVPIRILQMSAADQAVPAGQSAQADAVLIDDDSLARMTWSMAAKRAGMTLKAYPDAAAFFEESAGIPKNTAIYIDSNLADGIRGEDVANRIHRLGYTNIRLETGHEPSHFPPMAHIREVVGKNPPWPC